MITALKNALADYEEFLNFEDLGHAIKITVTTFIKDRHKFDALNQILYTNYNARYTPYDKDNKGNAFYVVSKPVKSEPKSFGDKPFLLTVAEGLEYEAKKLLEMAKDCRSQCQ